MHAAEIVKSDVQGNGCEMAIDLCYSACNFGSDSLLMKFAGCDVLILGENQHHASIVAAILIGYPAVLLLRVQSTTQTRPGSRSAGRRILGHVHPAVPSHGVCTADINAGLAIYRCPEEASSLWSLRAGFVATPCCAGDRSSWSVSPATFWRHRHGEPDGSIASSIISVSRLADVRRQASPEG